jgi:hypothetical protein
MASVLSAEQLLPILHRIRLHWSEVETELGHAFTLQGGYTPSLLTTEITTLETALAQLIEPDNDAERAATQRDLLRGPLLARFTQVKNAVLATLPGTTHAAALPTKPAANAGATATLKAFADLAELWETLNADTSLPATERPLMVAGGYGKGNFDDDRAALKLAFSAVEEARLRTTQRRKDRDTLLPPLRKRVTQYRARVKSLLPAGHRLLATLP